MWCNKPISKMTTTDELKIIASIRGKVMSRKDVTGVNLFLVWGYPTAFFLLLEFAALMVLHRNWCSWLWVGIPLIGVPLMIHYQRKDYDRTGHRTLPQNIALQLWLFIGGARFLHGLCRHLRNMLLHLPGSARRHGLFPYGCYLAFPSHDSLWHHGQLIVLCRSLPSG